MEADELSKMIMNDPGVKKAIQKVISQYILSTQPPTQIKFDRDVKIVNDYTAKSGILIMDFREHDALKMRVTKKFLPVRFAFRTTWKEYPSLPAGWNFSLAYLSKLKGILDEEGIKYVVVSKNTFPSTSTLPQDPKEMTVVTLKTKKDPKYGFKIITNEQISGKYVAMTLPPYGNCIVGVKDSTLKPNLANPCRSMKPLEQHHVKEIRTIFTKIPILEAVMIDDIQSPLQRDTLRDVYMC